VGGSYATFESVFAAVWFESAAGALLASVVDSPELSDCDAPDPPLDLP
jgi:hypothetical protein